SGPGFSLMLEGIGFAKITETPCIVIDVMRGGPSTGLPTKPSQSDIMQTRWGNHGDAPAIVLYPDSVLETYELTIRAVNLSEKYRTCVVLLTDEVLGHMREAVSLPDLKNIKIVNRIKPTVPPEWYRHYDENPKYIQPVASYGEGYRFHVTGLAHDDYGFPTNKADEIALMMDRLKKKVTHHLKDIIQIESFKMEDARTAIFAAGITARAAKSAVLMARKSGKRVGLIRPLTIWPFPDDAIRKYLRNVKNIFVPELNQGQLIKEVKRVMGGVWNYESRKSRQIIPIQKYNGELITPTEIVNAMKEVR
ncbi:MAG: 2-oxoacid:acceptor oxidoreductase subunit alpha, partial [Candidatus Cloacimonetes bacterium]|nr:2-oxoacid:acceptor oxidoreductase subunit alpha [Candidatus Cloacimonadota bacterium]